MKAEFLEIGKRHDGGTEVWLSRKEQAHGARWSAKTKAQNEMSRLHNIYQHGV